MKGIRRGVDRKSDLNRTAFRVVQDATRERDTEDAPDEQGTPSTDQPRRNRNGHERQRIG
jgi:hypothetical protein